MRYTSRPFPHGNDKQAMIDLVYAHPACSVHVADLPYRLSSWALDDPQNARLWFGSTVELLG
ncbi:MAG: hypothetical protein JXB15_07665 [Anaerolineales bacterium]|nr:hypothetical protein [Anaerolineales bacterium]